MKCLIIDDDVLMVHILEELLSEVEFVELAGTANNAKEAISFLHSNDVDLIFLDIEMPEINGIEFLQIFSRNSVPVIIVSSHKEYAFDAFEYNVIDYLLKPIDRNRLLKALGRARLNGNNTSISPESTENFYIKVNSSYQSVFFDKVLFIESLGDYISVVLEDRKITVHSTLKKIEQKLPERDFLRVHNSFIVRLDKIEKYEDNFITIRKALIPVSRSHKMLLNQKLNIL
ncbi:MAG: LytR/AlgR family response regulator transcription factor [Bacteroidota bacterium]